MYLPDHFADHDTRALHDLIERENFATLVTVRDGEIDANHLPFELDRSVGEFGMLRCHVARASQVWQSGALGGADSLIIFQGPSAYISPSLYPSKQTTHEVVPTYNYSVVHAYGRITVHHDAKWLRANVGRLTRHHEATQGAPWKMSDAPAPFIDALLGKIVGLEMTITRLVGKAKMSQNRSATDRQGVVDGLRATHPETAAEVAQRGRP